MKKILILIFAMLLLSFGFYVEQVHAAPCDNPPSGSCLEFTGDCEGAASNDELYVVGALDRVDARGVDWVGPEQDAHLFDTGTQPEPEVETGDSIYPSCIYGGRVESKLNRITTPYDNGGSGGDDGWHDLDSFQIDAKNLRVEGMHLIGGGDGIAQTRGLNGACTSGYEGPPFEVRWNWIEGSFDDAIESDDMGSAIIEYNYIQTYKTAFAARPIASCEAYQDASNNQWTIRDNLVEMLPGGSPIALGMTPNEPLDDGGGYVFKWPTTSQGDIGPKIAVKNNVFLIYDIASDEFGGQIFPLIDKLVTTGNQKCQGNVILFAGPSTDADSWEDYMDNHGSGPDSYVDGQRWGSPGNLYQTFTGASTPCYTLYTIEDHAEECITSHAIGSPEANACFRAKDFAALGTNKSWDDRVADWKASATADGE